MVAVIWDDDVWLPPNITWEYFDNDDRCSKTQLILKTGMICCRELFKNPSHRIGHFTLALVLHCVAVCKAVISTTEDCQS